MSVEDWDTIPPEIVDARYRKLEAEIEGQKLDNVLASSIAETSQMALFRERERYEWDQAGPQYSRIFYFSNEVTRTSAHDAIDTISRWQRIDRANENDQGYTMVISSPGGDVISGFQFYSFLCSVARERELTIIATGICASMATILHQAASEGRRFIEPGTTYLLHELSAATGGRLDAIQDTTKYFDKLNDHLREVYAARSHKTVEELKEAVERRECYLVPDEVVEWGLADKIVEDLAL